MADERIAAGRGRPAVPWRLTQAGPARFPDTHAALTVGILRSISQVMGENALDRIVAAREAAAQDVYEAAMSGCRTLEERVEKLAELRTAEGCMAQATRGEDGALRLMEHPCPICAAASVRQGVCRAEKAVFQALLRPHAEVEREARIVSGACTYVIRETAS